MGLPITNRARNIAKQAILEPAMVLEIEGVDTLFGMHIIKKYIRIGDPGLLIGGGWVIGGYNQVEDQSDIISLDGSTTQIRQQLLQDKGGTGSISAMQIALIDKDEEATRLITPGEVVDDIMGKKCKVWLSFADTAWPEDYVVIFQGVIDEITSDSKIILNISSPEQKKRQEVFTKIQTELASAINDSVTTIPVVSVSGLLLPADGTTLRTYVRIDDEIIQYAGVNTATNELTGCTRAAFDTVANAHDDESEVSSFYRLTGNGIDLALKLMMSGKEGPWVTGIPVASFVRVNPTTDVVDAVYFDQDIVTKHGPVVGDLMTITGATAGGNNVTEVAITSIQESGNGFFAVLDGPGLTLETVTSAVASIRSKYDVLGHGVAMGGDEVDVEEFERIADFYATSIPDYDFYLKDSEVARDFIDTQILFPMGAYSLPRKGKVSCGFTSPPIAIDRIPQLDAREVVAPQKSQVKRSAGKFFYNTIVFRFQEDTLEEKFLAGRVTVDADSRNRIDLGSRPMTITARGLRNDDDTIQIIDSIARRLLERYRFAAEMVKTNVQYGVGYAIEVGDIVLYGDDELVLPDTKFGSRGFRPRLMEVVNKSLNIKTGEVSLELLDTSYATNGRYGIFSPASEIDVGSSTTVINIKRSFGLDASEIEADKWRNYIGQKLLIHDQDWTYQYETRLNAINPANQNQLQINAVPVPPGEDDIIEIIPYPDNDDAEDSQLLKALHCFFDPQVEIVSGASGTEFDVDPADVDKFIVGASVLVHDEDFGDLSEETVVTEIDGTTITVRDDLGFTPSAGHLIELIGFKDGGPAYRWL